MSSRVFTYNNQIEEPQNSEYPIKLININHAWTNDGTGYFMTMVSFNIPNSAEFIKVVREVYKYKIELSQDNIKFDFGNSIDNCPRHFGRLLCELADRILISPKMAIDVINEFGKISGAMRDNAKIGLNEHIPTRQITKMTVSQKNLWREENNRLTAEEPLEKELDIFSERSSRLMGE